MPSWEAACAVIVYLLSALACWLQVRYEFRDDPHDITGWYIALTITPVLNTMVGAIATILWLDEIMTSNRFARKFFGL